MRRMLFLNIAWMHLYRGLGQDTIVGEFEYVQEKGYGHEIYNFLPLGGRMYGYARVRGQMAIERLGASSGDDYVDDVLVVWVSRRPQGGVVVVGWYDHSKVFRSRQVGPPKSERTYQGEVLAYRVVAQADDCVLLPMFQRRLAVPAGVPGGLGRSNIWYAEAAEMSSFRESVLDLVNKHDRP